MFFKIILLNIIFIIVVSFLPFMWCMFYIAKSFICFAFKVSKLRQCLRSGTSNVVRVLLLTNNNIYTYSLSVCLVPFYPIFSLRKHNVENDIDILSKHYLYSFYCAATINKYMFLASAVSSYIYKH